MIKKLRRLICVLFGVHGVIHYIGVTRAWKFLYKEITWRDKVAILIHDIGYFNCKDFRRHPELGSKLAKLVNREQLVLYHSKEYCDMVGANTSKLWLPDKISWLFISYKSLAWVVKYIDWKMLYTPEMIRAKAIRILKEELINKTS